MNLLPLVLLFLLTRSSRSSSSAPPPEPSLVPVGTRAIARTHAGNIPVVFETVLRGGARQAVWSVQDLGSSNLGQAQAALAGDVGRTFAIHVRSDAIFRARWDGFVFVPVP